MRSLADASGWYGRQSRAWHRRECCPGQSVSGRDAALYAVAPLVDGSRRAAPGLHERQSLRGTDGHRDRRRLAAARWAGPRRLHGQDAVTEAIADLLLVHDRPIVRPVDDSVARVGPDGLQVLRRARGFAPLPIKLNFAAPTILAVGGHLKNTVALAVGGARRLRAPSLRRAQPAHRRSGKSAEFECLPPGDRRSAGILRRKAPSGGLRSAPRLCFHALCRRTGPQVQSSPRPRAASSRPRGRMHGGAWSGGSRAGARLGRHGLWPRRHDLGRRGPLVPRRGLSSRGPSADLPLAWRRSGGETAARGRHWDCCTRSWVPQALRRKTG